MPINSFIYLSSISKQKEGSIESQIFCLTNRVIKLSYHFKTHGKDYSSQRGLWKILGRRKRLLAYLVKTNLTSYEDLTNQLGIRRLRRN
uniref:Small ribosomal subunit protein uS15c n=1 Tax=Ptilidium pulcherrimum TaxID=3143427 RepID=F5GV55_9MARC|nr:ribosomal protein S15 [Ptilidium ciliare var. pulcherrimum]ADK89657.1 ribosomal protein S15 [Ptilidium ciliare var. pulcherrimum]